MRKATLGRNYFHLPTFRLEGTSIIIPCGSPKRAKEAGSIPYKEVDGQKMNYVEYIPFEHTPKSGKEAKANFKKSVEAHHKKINEALDRFPGSIFLDKITKSSKIVQIVKT